VGYGWRGKVLGGAVVAPVLAVAGIAYAIHGSKALENAQDVKQQIADAVDKMDKAKEQLFRVEQYAQKIASELERIYVIFQEYFELLKDVNEIVKNGDEEKIRNLTATANLYIQNGIILAAIMAKLISTPLFKVKRDLEGGAILGNDNLPQIQVDADGIQILDKARVDKALETASEVFYNFKNSR